MKRQLILISFLMFAFVAMATTVQKVSGHDYVRVKQFRLQVNELLSKTDDLKNFSMSDIEL